MRRWKSLMARCVLSVVATCSLGIGATALAATPAGASTPHWKGTYEAHGLLAGTLVLGQHHEGEAPGTPLTWSTSHGTITIVWYYIVTDPTTGQPVSIPVYMAGHWTNTGISSASDPGTVTINGGVEFTWYAVRVSGG